MQLKQLFLGLGQQLKLTSVLCAKSLSESFVMLFQEKSTESPECANPAKIVSSIPDWQSVFADFDYDYIELGHQLPFDWKDTAWRNDACPSFSLVLNAGTMYETTYKLWFDYKDISKSEFTEYRKSNEMKMFDLTDELGNEVFASNDWNEILEFVQSAGVYNHYDNEAEKRATDTDG